LARVRTVRWVACRLEHGGQERLDPLHHAVKNNALNSMEFLLDNGVDDVRLNHQREAAIHVAVIHNQLNALKVRSSLENVFPSLCTCVYLFLVDCNQTSRSGESRR
jgi:Ankyrin repeats (3 copies)